MTGSGFTKRYGDLTGMETAIADLRHSVVYALRKGNCDVKNIQAWLGHSDITTTLNVYGHVLNGDMDQLGQVMDNIFSKGSKAS